MNKINIKYELQKIDTLSSYEQGTREGEKKRE